MKISKKDALSWFTFFAALPEEEELMVRQQEIVYATFAQIEAAVDARNPVSYTHLFPKMTVSRKNGEKSA